MIPVRCTGSEHFYFILSTESVPQEILKSFFSVKASIGSYYLLWVG